MANDNILAGLAGFLEGAREVAVPFFQAKYKAQLQDELDQKQLARKQAAELDMFKTKLPYELEAKRQEATFSAQAQAEAKRGLLPFEQELNIGRDRQRTQTLGSKAIQLFPQLEGKIDPKQYYANDLLEKYATEAGKQGKAGKTLPNAQLSAIGAAKNTIDLLDSVIAQAEGKKIKTGPAALRFMDIPGASTYRSMVGDENDVQFKSDMTDLKATYASAKTGAARGFKEIAWLSAAMPEENLDNQKLVAVAKRAKSRMVQNYRNLLDTAGKAGYNVGDFGDIQSDEARTPMDDTEKVTDLSDLDPEDLMDLLK